MLNTSHNVLFVYSLLLIDLLVNISDNLIPGPSYLVRNVNTNELEITISSWTFTIFIIQIIAIICVVIDLVVHFFNVSDQVKQIAWLIESKHQISEARPFPQEQQQQNQQLHQHHHHQCQQLSPMPQRVALKLVLDRYWWSLLVGLIYLVLTIVLQIIRLDPSWHHNRGHYLQQGPKTGQAVSENLIQLDTSPDLMFALFGQQESGKEELATSSATDRFGLLQAQQEEGNSNRLLPGEQMGQQAGGDLQPQLVQNNRRAGNRSENISLLPVLIVLIHKLMSTCYYVSFVVVYRATPSQMVNRILFISGKQQQQQQQQQHNQAANQTVQRAPDESHQSTLAQNKEAKIGRY